MPENVFARMLNWLRAGYPDGIPATDYVALLGILHRELTEREIARLAHQLREEGGISQQISEARIAEAIESEILQKPSEEDIRRVQEHLAAGGWTPGAAHEAEQA